MCVCVSVCIPICMWVNNSLFLSLPPSLCVCVCLKTPFLSNFTLKLLRRTYFRFC